MTMDAQTMEQKSDEDKQKKRLVASVRSHFVASGRTSMSSREILNEYRNQEGRDLAFANYGYRDAESFLIEEAKFRRLGNGLLTFTSENSKHIADLLDGQRTKPKMTSAPRNFFRQEPLPPQHAAFMKPRTSESTLGLNNLSKDANPVFSQESLERDCQKFFTQPFRHELRVKLKAFHDGCTPEEFREYFNSSNFEKFGYRKDLDLKGLTLMEFCQGLPDVFRLETENGTVKLFPVLTGSLSLNKLGNRKPPMQSFAQRASQPYRPTNEPAVTRLPTINEMSVVFKQVCETHAGQEVSLNDFLKKVRELGNASDGSVETWLRARRFDMEDSRSIENFSEFITEKLSLPIDLIPGKNAVFIRGSPRLERPPSAPSSVPDSSNLSYLKHEPFSIAYKMERLPLGGGSIDIDLNCFDLQAPNFYFTLVSDAQKRLELMKKLKQHGLTPLPRAQLEKGVPCLVAGENKAFFRSSVLKVEDTFVDVYYVDLGETLSVAFDQVFRISDEHLRDSVYAYPATMVNVRPVDGGNTFKIKTLQDISCELDNAVVKATILRFDESSKKYEVDLGETAMSLQRDGLLLYDDAKPSPVMSNGFRSGTAQVNGAEHRPASTNGFQQNVARTNGHAHADDSSDVTVVNKVLPNCETILVVQRDSCDFILSSDVSRVLGLAQNTFLSTLKQFDIAVEGSWKPSPKVLEQLRASDNNAEPTADDVLIPLKAVAPLMRAFLWITGEVLDNEKNMLKAFLRK